MNFEKNSIALYTLLRKETLRVLRIWSQTLLPPAITMTLYFIVFGRLIGSQIKSVNGFSYIQYIAPGLVMMSMMMNAYANTSTSFFGSKFSRSIEELLVSSMSNTAILIGYILGGTVRALLTGLIVLSIAMLFTHVHLQHIWIVIVMAILCCMVFSLGGLINGIFAKRFDDVAFLPTFILTPLTYLGGFFIQ